MRNDYDLDEILYLAERGMSSAFIVEELGLRISERQVQRLVRSRLGPRPTRVSVSRPNVVRERVVAHMQSRGLNPRHCSSCGKHTIHPTMIHAVNADLSLDALVFVCTHCAVPGDR